MSAIVKNYSHKKGRSKHAGRVLPAVILFLVFCGIFTVLFCTSFFKPTARAENLNNSTDTVTDLPVETTAILTPVAIEEESEPDTVACGSFVPVGVNSLVWLNKPLLDDYSFTPSNTASVPQTRYQFTSGSGKPLPGYTWGGDIPETEAVGSEYYADTVFIGNSIEEGFMLYSGLTTGDFFATKSITVKNIYTEKAVNNGNGGYITIMDALGRKKYSKVYILLGLNEIDYNTDVFCQMYSDLIDAVLKLQPAAEIYIQSLTPVTKKQDESGSIYNNKSIRKHNTTLKKLAEEKKAHFVNIYEALADSEGNLPADGSYDGIHPYKKYYQKWYDYLNKHTVTEVAD